MLDGLLYRPDSAVTTHETKSGIPKYTGGPIGFEEWKFKIEGRIAALNAQVITVGDESAIAASRGEVDRKLIEFSSKVVEALEGEALKVAMELGHPSP